MDTSKVMTLAKNNQPIYGVIEGMSQTEAKQLGCFLHLVGTHRSGFGKYLPGRNPTHFHNHLLKYNESARQSPTKKN